jgi:uncharacterized membrane protein YeiH
MSEWLQLAGLAAFAVSGVEASRAKRPDLIGALILAFVTALGGGVMRDAILGRPAQSFADGGNLLVILVAATAALPLPLTSRFGSTLRVADALGLGLFNAIGLVAALESGVVSPGFAVVVGAVTGCGGGILRDVLCGEMPALLRPGEIYVTACLAGGVVGLALHAAGIDPGRTSLAVALVTITIRLLAIARGWKLPAIGS